jgi:hypothetical protein
MADYFTEVIFDVETQKLFEEIGDRDPGKLLISVVSLYRRKLDSEYREIEGEMKSFWVPEARLFPTLDEMWSIFEDADRIIGFNTLGFDIAALQPYWDKNFSDLPHFDILEEIRRGFGRRVSLDAVAKETIGLDQSKIASGLDAVAWWKMRTEESLANLKKYCEEDVRVTKDVYDFGLKKGKLKFKDRWNEPREVEVDFSYKKNEGEGPTSPEASLGAQQMGLF